MAEPKDKQPVAQDDTQEASEITSTSFLTPATNPSIPPSGRQSIDFSDKVPQVMQWTSTIAKERSQLPSISTSDVDHDEDQDPGALTPTFAGMRVGHEADLEELHNLTPIVVEVPAYDGMSAGDSITLNWTNNPSYLSSKPYSISSHYARSLDVPGVVPSPPSSVIAEPPSPTLSHASLKFGTTLSSTSSSAGDDTEQDQETEQESIHVSQSSDHDQPIDNSSSSSATIDSHEKNVAQPAEEDRVPSAFVIPRKEILTKEDLELFHASPTYASLFEFLEALNESVVGVVSTADCYQSEVSCKRTHRVILKRVGVQFCLAKSIPTSSTP